MASVGVKVPAAHAARTALEAAAASFRLPFSALPITKETKPQQEAQVLDLLKRHDVDLVVLARYMQVLSDDFLTKAPPVRTRLFHLGRAA